MSDQSIASDILSRLQTLEARVAKVEAIASAYLRIDLVEYEDRLAYYYVDDASYRFLPDAAHKNVVLTPALAGQYRQKPSAAPASIFSSVFEQYWANQLPFTFFDVGANVGTVSIDAANTFRAASRHHRIVAFEPGVYRHLLPYNFELNGLEAMVSTEALAVGDFNGSALMLAEVGESVNNRIGLRDVSTEWRSEVVKTVTLDTYCASHGIADHIVLKIDTQGHDWKVILGASGLCQERFVTMLFEFTPWALRTYCDPIEVLETLMTKNWVVDCGPHTKGVPTLIADSQAGVMAVEQNSLFWTDMLVIPKALPGAERLLDIITTKPLARGTGRARKFFRSLGL